MTLTPVFALIVWPTRRLIRYLSFIALTVLILFFWSQIMVSHRLATVKKYEIKKEEVSADYVEGAMSAGSYALAGGSILAVLSFSLLVLILIRSRNTE